MIPLLIFEVVVKTIYNGGVERCFNTANKCNGGVETELEEREVETFQHS
jgi:hypothetical protein